MSHNTEVADELRRLVASDPAERDVQVFLERHPWLLVHGHIHASAVISQFPLGADHRSDFAYFVRMSGGDYLQLIEIESPRLEIFNENDGFSAAFNHALQQLEDWAGWVERNRESIEFCLEPLIIDGPFTAMPRFVRVRLLLIAGRRSQITNPRRKRRWEERVNRLPRTTEVRTFEGFIESLPLVWFDHIADANAVRCVRYAQQAYKELG